MSHHDQEYSGAPTVVTWVSVKDQYPEHGQAVWYAFGVSKVRSYAGHFEWITDPVELGGGRVDCFHGPYGYLSCGDVQWWAPRNGLVGEEPPEPPIGALTIKERFQPQGGGL